MKELHNHIFSNTTCISKETMLKHINNQLTKNELHEVEKHMLDCDLCSDAYAGMQFTQNSSMLFAIDNAIDKRAGGKASNVPIMRSLMVAASVLVIVFGAYFTVDYFNTVVDNNQGLALQEFKEQKSMDAPIEESIAVESSEFNEVNDDGEKEALKIDLKEKSFVAENKNKVIENSPKTIVKEVEQDDLMSDNSEIMEDFEEPETILVEEVEEEAPVSELRSALGNVITSADEVLMKEEKTAEKNKADRKRNKKSAVAPALSTKIAENESSKFKDELNDNMLTIEGFKVFDYKEEYQRAYDKKVADDFVTESVSAGYETKADKELANKSLEEIIVEVTYKDALDKAMRLYKNEKYREAIQEYDNILAKHPEDVNAQFYYGLCKYHLGQNSAAIKKFDRVLKNRQTEFNEEATWYKALTLLKMKNTTSAKKLLKDIVKQNGFYKAKAEEKLKEM